MKEEKLNNGNNMLNFNKAIIVGNITQDPEKKVTDNGTTITTFSVATNRKYKGEKQTEYHNVVSFGNTAEAIAQYMSKGSQILLEGRLQTRSWEKDGQKHYRTEIVANRVEFGSSEKKENIKDSVEEDDIDVENDIPF